MSRGVKSDGDRREEVVFGKVVKMWNGANVSGGGAKGSDTGIVVGGEGGDKGAKDFGMVREWREGRRQEDMIDMGAIYGGRDVLWMSVSQSEGRVEGVGRAKEVMENGVWVGWKGKRVVLKIAKNEIGEIGVSVG